jgi:hypothetical protein
MCDYMNILVTFPIDYGHNFSRAKSTHIFKSYYSIYIREFTPIG